MLIFVMTRVNVSAKTMLKVKSVPHVWLVATTFLLAQVTKLHKFNCTAQTSQLTKCFIFHSACACETQGTVGNVDSCNDNGVCTCKPNVEGAKCDTCSAGFYNFPDCTGRCYKSICIEHI